MKRYLFMLGMWLLPLGVGAASQTRFFSHHLLILTLLSLASGYTFGAALGWYRKRIFEAALDAYAAAIKNELTKHGVDIDAPLPERAN